MVKTNTGFEQFKAKVTLELLDKLNPEFEWKSHDNGSWYSCNDFARGGGGNLVGVKRLEIQAVDISALLDGIKLRAEAVYNKIASAVDEWYSIFEGDALSVKSLEPEQLKVANPPDVTILKTANDENMRKRDDCSPY